MKGKIIVAVAVGAAVFAGCRFFKPASGVWEPSARLWSKKFLGRDYWTIQTHGYYTAKIKGETKDVSAVQPSTSNLKPEAAMPPKPLNPELRALPAFQDTGIYYSFGRGPRWEDDKATWRTVRENFCSLDKRDDKAWEGFRPKNDGRPALCVFQHHRGGASLSGEIDLDFEDYAAFTNGLPNLLGYSMLSEWMNDAKGIEPRCQRMEKQGHSNRADRIRREWCNTKESNYDFLKRFWDRRVATYYGDYAHCMPLSSCGRSDHLECVWGAHRLTVETSGTTGHFMEYRWDAATMITRGAARQFDVPWNWYIAQYSCGYTHDTHKWVSDAHSVANERGMKAVAAGHPWNGPDGGLSASIMRRATYLSYLIGANFTQPEYSESWMRVDPATGRDALTTYGTNWVSYCDFTKAHPDRGALVTPVALLAPWKQFYTSFGGSCDGGGHMIDGAMFTLCPAANRGEYVKHGGEGHLHPSKFAQFTDYLVADSPQKREEYLAALTCYPAAVLIGEHEKDVDIASPLREYVAAGGRLVVNAIYLKRAGFGADFTGVSWDGETYEEKREPTDFEKRNKLKPGVFEYAVLSPVGATVLERDAAGRPMMTSCKYGKGEVIVTAQLYMTRKYDKNSSGLMIPGLLKSPWFEKVFAKLQHEHYPIALKRGKVMWGLNRTKSGWWVWALNNQGVTKYPDIAESIDGSKAETVTVDVSKLGVGSATELITGKAVTCAPDGTITFTVPAGDLAIVELK